MPDTFIQLTNPYIKEKHTVPITAYFRNSSDAATAPTTVHYRIDCLSTGTVVLDWTSVSAAASVSITVKAGENKIINNGNQRERKQVTVSADKGTDNETRDIVIWVCENIMGFDG